MEGGEIPFPRLWDKMRLCHLQGGKKTYFLFSTFLEPFLVASSGVNGQKSLGFNGYGYAAPECRMIRMFFVRSSCP